LIIYPGNVTPTATPRPLKPIEKLTPADDGNYYHTVQSGETLLWIAGLYEVSLNDLMSWNGLNSSSIIRPEQKLVLQVTPPVTETPTPPPATETSTPTATTVPPTSTQTPTLISPSPTATSAPASLEGKAIYGWGLLVVLAGSGLALVGMALRKK
jgi:hypothetical protein